MSDILSLAAAKAHLRVTGTSEDENITGLIAAAAATIADHLNRPLIGADPGWATVGDVPANVVHAVKLVLTALYDDRDGGSINWTSIDALTGRYMIVGFA